MPTNSALEAYERYGPPIAAALGLLVAWWLTAWARRKRDERAAPKLRREAEGDAQKGQRPPPAT